MSRRGVRSVALLSLLALSVAMYVMSGLADAYLVADDFQGIAGGHVFTWDRIRNALGTNSFYRPVIDVWFAVVVRVCGSSTTCYHGANLTIHLANVALCFYLGVLLAGGVRVPFLAGLLFALVPGDTQAVVWVSAVTELSATLFFLASLVAQARSWSVSGEVQRKAHEVLAVLCLVGALFSHEAAATLPLVSVVMWWQFKPGTLRQRRILVVGFVVALATFVGATWLANRRNTLFLESNYTVGWHGLRHAFGYLVALYVGPPGWLAYLFCLAGVTVLLLANATTRFGTIFMLATIVPFVWFTSGTYSRHLYLPAAGFSIAVGAGLTALVDLIGPRSRLERSVVRVAYGVAVLFIAVRFGQFYLASIQGHVKWTRPWQDYAKRLSAETRRADSALRAPPMLDPEGRTSIYVEPIVRWMFDDYTSPVIVEPAAPR